MNHHHFLHGRVLIGVLNLVALAVGLIGNADADTHDRAEITEISPNVLVFATSSGNVVASIGVDGALLVGKPAAASTEEIGSILARRMKSNARYVVIYPEDAATQKAMPVGDTGEHLLPCRRMRSNAWAVMPWDRHGRFHLGYWN